MPCHGHGSPSDPDYPMIISGYLHSDNVIALSAMITDFTKPLNYAYINKHADASQIENLLWAAWGAVTTAAKRAEPGSADQEKLVNLMVKLKNQGTLTRHLDTEECVVWGMKVYEDLPVFGAVMRGCWNDTPPGGLKWDEWRNINAFAARLTEAGIDFSLYGIWSLREALEEEKADGDLQMLLPAAVEWYRWFGQDILRRSKEGSRFQSRRKYGKPGKCGALAEQQGVKEEGYSMERWNFWKTRLEDFTFSEGMVAAKAREASELIVNIQNCGQSQVNGH